MPSNKLGILNSIELAKEEERISKYKAKVIFESNLLRDKRAGTVSTLLWIHRFLFEDIYDFAGKIRDVNISKGNFRFASAMYLKEVLTVVEKMPQKSFGEIIAKYVEMNIAHPFLEGNGRSMRLWLDHILREELQVAIDWNKVGKEDYLLAMERSPVRDTEIKELLNQALTTDVNSREVFVKGLDASYGYEGLNRYHTAEL
ncbi:MAG: Fic family protein [Eubacteriales bacterium]|nr:Fic family protein [Eubacteriales bacterium]